MPLSCAASSASAIWRAMRRRFIERHRTFGRFALDVLHHQVIRADVVQRANVGMIQRGDGPRLLLEALGELFVGDFDGYNAVQPRVAGLVDDTHPARADGFEDLVGSQAFANRKRHRLSGKFTRLEAGKRRAKAQR